MDTTKLSQMDVARGLDLPPLLSAPRQAESRNYLRQARNVFWDRYQSAGGRRPDTRFSAAMWVGVDPVQPAETVSLAGPVTGGGVALCMVGWTRTRQTPGNKPTRRMADVVTTLSVVDPDAGASRPPIVRSLGGGMTVGKDQKNRLDTQFDLLEEFRWAHLTLALATQLSAYLDGVGTQAPWPMNIPTPILGALVIDNTPEVQGGPAKATAYRADEIPNGSVNPIPVWLGLDDAQRVAVEIHPETGVSVELPGCSPWGVFQVPVDNVGWALPTLSVTYKL